MVHGYRASVGQSGRPVVAMWVSWSDATAPATPDHGSASGFVRTPLSDLFCFVRHLFASFPQCTNQLRTGQTSSDTQQDKIVLLFLLLFLGTSQLLFFISADCCCHCRRSTRTSFFNRIPTFPFCLLCVNSLLHAERWACQPS